MSRIKAIAISDTTNADRNQVWLEDPVPVRAPSFKLSVKFVRSAAKAGARLQTAPVTIATTRANAATVGVNRD